MSAGLRTRCTVLFADLRGSTSLYERLGNAAAAGLVTQIVQALATGATGFQGRVVKTLGDGLIALFASAQSGVEAALNMQALIAGTAGIGLTNAATNDGSSGIRLHVALEHGDVIELGEDVYGDAVNVAARLLDHAGDQEILVTHQVLEQVDEPTRRMFRSLDTLSLRGREQPVTVHACALRQLRDGDVTCFESWTEAAEPDGIRLWGPPGELILGPRSLPALLGRGVQVHYMVSDASTSRMHAQLELRGPSIQITDLSSNGTHVQFSDGELVTLRRTSCILHGRGRIGLGRLPEPGGTATVDFELVRLAPTQPAL
jgi:adenylate cyclase